MAIPDFQSIFLPLLKYSGDGKDHTNKESVGALAEIFKLTEEEHTKLLPSGKQPTFMNRVLWAKTYLSKAGLLSSPSRGVFKITERGREVLASPPEKLNVKYLKKYEEFTEFHTYNPKSKIGERTNGNDNQLEVEDKTPEELLSIGYNDIRRTLISDLLESIKQMSPSFFESLVVDLLLKMGYGGASDQSGFVVGKSGDEGIDGIISEDKLGLDIIYIQAKRWEGKVGRPEIQKFVGALQGKRAKKGVFITASNFSSEAQEYVNQVDTRVILIDGHHLANLMIDHNVGVSLKESYEVKKIDSDYFIEE
jgi:restriction system protein